MARVGGRPEAGRGTTGPGPGYLLAVDPRPTPFDLVFHELADARFPAIRDALAAAGHDPRDRDAFLLTRPAVELLRELRPEEGVGEGMDHLAAIAHHGFVHWMAGAVVLPVTLAELDLILADGNPADAEGDAPAAWYAQFPEMRIWAQVVEGDVHEPLDGLFAHALPDGTLRVLGVFGLHPDRAGFSVVEVGGPRPAALAREDGRPLFAPAMPGAEAAGLHSITGAEELLELGWRTRRLARAAAAAAM